MFLLFCLTFAGEFGKWATTEFIMFFVACSRFLSDCGMKIEKKVDGDWNFGIIRKAPISMDEVFPLPTGMVINLQIPSLNVSASQRSSQQPLSVQAPLLICGQRRSVAEQPSLTWRMRLHKRDHFDTFTGGLSFRSEESHKVVHDN